MNFANSNIEYQIPVVRKKEQLPPYLLDYEKYIRVPKRSPAENTIKNFLLRLKKMDKWLRHNRQFLSRMNGTSEQVLSEGPLFHVTNDDLDNFFGYMYDNNYSVSTRLAYRSAFADFIKYAQHKKNLSFVPDYTHIKFKKTHKEQHSKPKQYLSAEHVQTIRDNIYKIPDDSLKKQLSALRSIAIFELLVTTGCRKWEIMNIKYENVDFDKKCIHIFGAKTAQLKDGWRFVPFSQDSVRNAVRLYLEEFRRVHNINHMTYLFPLQNKGKKPQPLSPQVIDREVKEWSKYIDIPLNPHMFRHYCGTQLATKAISTLNNFTYMDGANILGDELATFIKRYVHPDSKDSVNKLIEQVYTV